MPPHIITTPRLTALIRTKYFVDKTFRQINGTSSAHPDNTAFLSIEPCIVIQYLLGILRRDVIAVAIFVF